MPMNIGKIRVLKDFAKIFIQKEMFEDLIPTAVVCFYLSLYYWSATFTFFIPLFAYYKPQIGIFFVLYSCWIYYDRNTPSVGGRKLQWLCNSKLANAARDYFPFRLIKTADLPEGRNYILAHYPHSVVPFNILPNFMNNSNKVADSFPGIETHYLTNNLVFLIPLVRDIMLAIGGCSCSESSFTYLLKRTPSKGIIVVPGGASEVKYACSGSIYTIIRRKGFIRLALATGTPLVPVFTFGEINTWTKLVIMPLGQPFKWILKSLLKSSADVFIPMGRGLLPRKVPVYTIVGAPISVPKVETPSTELIDKYYEIFFQALQDIFEKYKHEYDIAGEKAKLIMV